MGKRILIVDDQKRVASILAKSIADQGPDYEVETANSGEEALAKVVARPFDLIITDLRLPGVSGLELIERVRIHTPHTRLILMTGYGNPDIETIAYRLGACRYLAKPFPLQALFSAVQDALVEVETPRRDILLLSDEHFDEIARCLTDLRFELGAQCVLLADISGQMLTHVGTIEGIDLRVLISLVGGGFATACELARHLGEDQALTLNYHEGSRLDIYSTNINENVFLVLLFDKRQRSSRIGMVWLYTRRVLKQLQALINSTDQVALDQVLGNDFGNLLSSHLDQVFSSSSPEDDHSQKGETTSLEMISGEVPRTVQKDISDSSTPHSSSSESHSTVQTPTFTLEQALKMGLLDPSWEQNLDGGE